MKVQKRRKREGKTDYLTRIKLLKSEKPRLVFRKSNKLTVVQYIKSNEAKDKIIFGFTSKALLNHGWPKNLSGSLKSIPASYLVGYLTGKKIQKEKLTTPITDFGMQRTVKKSRIFAFIKGLIDSGLKINCKAENLPDEDKISEKIGNLDEIKKNIDKA